MGETRKKINDILKEYKVHLQELKEGITNWNWSDPVSSMYSKTFSENCIAKISISEEDLASEYTYRIENDIPPGNRDKSKENNSIGDFLIWKTILELGKTQKKDIVFISNDEKNDWLLKGNKKSISTKYELVHEYYEKTNTNNFICMTFSDFLEKQGLEVTLIEDFSFDKPLNVKAFEQSTGTLESLNTVYAYINDFIQKLGTEDESVNIEEKISEPIKHFISAFRNEYFATSNWQYFNTYFFRFQEWLSEINSYNSEITYQEFRMKRNTGTDRIKMIALAKVFVSLYEDFRILT